MKKLIFAVALAAVATLGRSAQGGQAGQAAGGAGNQDPWASGTFNELRLRAVGPALMSGRVNVVAVHPEDKQTWYIGVASGGVWKTTNAGTTFTPVFQNEGSYSIGTVVIDPKNPNTDLGRHRRSQQPAQRRLRRRHLSQRRCRPDLAQPGAEGLAAHRPHRDRSARFEGRLRRGLRPAVERRRRSRPLQDHRRRRELDEDPQHQRAHRHQRRRDGSEQSRRADRDRAPAAPSHVDADPRRTRKRHPQVHRRRRDVAAHPHRACPAAISAASCPPSRRRRRA